MEKVKDLFAPKSGDLRVRLNPGKGFYVEGLTKSAVADYAVIEKLMEAGSKARTVAATNMNATSSRAHTIFQITLTQTIVQKELGKATDRVALINLIDLAGSERADSTGATGERLKEGSMINLSLSSLGNVISALAANSDESNKKKVRVPYRDSTLTMLLENSLGGNAKTIMIAAISPADINHDETLSTLRYADRAKQIKNKAIINEDPNEKLIRNLRQEIEELRRALQGGGVSAIPGAVPDLEEERQKMRAEIEAERERMKLELEEKLKEELEMDKSWEDKIAETKALQVAREAELRELGILTGEEREKALEKAKEVPHLTNLHEDPQMNEQVIYFLDPNSEVSIGRKDADAPKDIKLAGLSIQKDHALIKNKGADGITVEPASTGAKIYVNGVPITSPTPLHHGTRIIFGTTHVYKVVAPAEAAAGRPIDGEDVPEKINHEFALAEINAAQVKAIAAEEAKRRQQAEEEKRIAEAKMKEMEAKMAAEREAAEREAAEKIAEYERKARELAGNADQLKSLQEAQAKLEQEAKKKQEELEAQLRAQMEAMQTLQRKKDKEMRERSLLDEKLLKTIPLINEANAICDEMSKNMTFEPKLMATTLNSSSTGGDLNNELGTDVFIRVIREGGPESLWSHFKFSGRLYAMREYYLAWSENNKSVEGTEFANQENDPFYDDVEDVLIGKSTIYLDSIKYCLPIEEATPIIDYKGTDHGELLLRIVPHTSEAVPKSALNQVDDVDDEDEEFCENIEEIIGQRLGITVFIDGARGIPHENSNDVHIKFRFFLENDLQVTTKAAKRSINPKIEWHKTFSPVVTKEFIKWVENEAIEFEVWGKPQAAEKKDTPPVSRVISNSKVPAANEAPVISPAQPAPSSSPIPSDKQSQEEDNPIVIKDAPSAETKVETPAPVVQEENKSVEPAPISTEQKVPPVIESKAVESNKAAAADEKTSSESAKDENLEQKDPLTKENTPEVSQHSKAAATNEVPVTSTKACCSIQ